MDYFKVCSVVAEKSI